MPSLFPTPRRQRDARGRIALPFGDWLLRRPWFPEALQWPLLAVGVAALLLSFRPAVRSELNPGAALVWQLWWAVLPFLLLLTARFWCAVCPFATLASLRQKLSPLAPSPIPSLLRRVGPWLAAVGVAVLGLLFLALPLENNGPGTGVLLAAVAFGAFTCSTLWEGRGWCRYLCPVGLMAGLYSRLAWLRLEAEVRSHEGVLSIGRLCPLSTSPYSPTRVRDCVLCGGCLRGHPGERITLSFGPPPYDPLALSRAEAVATSLLMGLLLVDAFRMTPLYTRYMSWAISRTMLDYEAAMLVGTVGLMGGLIVAQAVVASLAASNGGWGVSFVRVSAALLPLALATHLGLSAQHLTAAGDVLRNLVAELGLLDPGHMPPADAYFVLWPLKLLQGSFLLAAGVVSLRLVRVDGDTVGRYVVRGVAALLLLTLLWVFGQPMSASC